MTILEINAVPYGSTGRIAKQIQMAAQSRGHNAYFAYSWIKRKGMNLVSAQKIHCGKEKHVLSSS